MAARAAAAVLLVAMAVCLAAYIEREDAGPRAEIRFMYLPSSEYLDVTSLGYRALLADVIFIWSIQYYGDIQTYWHERYDYLWHMFDVITDLDPAFTDPYYFGSFVMAQDAKIPDMAVRLLEKGISRIPDEWFFHYQAGFLLYQQERFEEAAEFFAQATGQAGMSVSARRMHAAMLARAGKYEDAFRLWREICLDAEEVWIRSVAGGHLFDLQVKMDSERVARAAADFRARHGLFPPSLAALVREGFLDATPRDPYDKPYAYNPETGAIASRSEYNFYKPPLSCIPEP